MRPADITSTANPRVKAWAALRKRSARDSTGTFLVEGERETLRARATMEVMETVLRDDRSDLDDGTSTIVNDKVFWKLSARQNPDGVLCVVRTPDLSLGSLPDASNLILVADGIEKPGNLGAMLRTCDAFGATFVGSEIRTDLVNPNVVRSAQGSLNSAPMAVAARHEAIGWCAARTQIVIADADGERNLWEVDLKVPVSVVVGSEDDGVHQSWFDHGERVGIPMGGAADSLNASVSAALFLAEAARQRSM